MTLYKDASFSTQERVADLMARMTVEEKIAQLGAQWLILDPEGEHKERELEMSDSESGRTLSDKLKLGIGQITRPLGTHTVSPVDGVKALNELQKFLVEETRLGIPAISHEECLVGLMSSEATLYPSSLNYGHTWNPELIYNAASDIGRQVRAVGAKQGLAPVLDVSRDVRWGRTEETLGEDPYLVGVMATQYVKGLQGENRDLYATLKHYVGHSASEGARNHAPVNLGFKELNDTFMLPFEMAVKLGNAGSVMPAYHDIDGEPCHASHYLLTEVLREQWGFDGLIVADYGGIDLLAAHHAVAADSTEAAALAFNAGLDVELPDDACSNRLTKALEAGLVSLDTIDTIVERILKTKFEFGLFENPYIEIPTEPLHNDKSTELSYKIASESAVLLKNDGTLPLSKQTPIAVVGATANDPLALLGGYSFPVHLILSDTDSGELNSNTLLQSLKESFETVEYAKGCDILTERRANAPVFPGDVSMAIAQDQISPVSKDTSFIQQAVDAAQQSEVIVACVGDLAGLFQTGTIGEGSDTDSLELPGVQREMLDALLDTGKPVVVLVTGGRPYQLGRAEDEASAILYGWAPGQEGANAIADILSGEENPSGKLTLSIPKNVGAVPYFYNHKLKSAGTPIAYHFGSAYNFGFGLSYTQFDYKDVELTSNSVEFDGTIEASVTITNTGARAGAEVVQLYTRDKLCSVVRPVKELKGFHKVWLEAGESKRITFSLPVDMLNFTNAKHQRVVEGGEFEIMIGRSSSEIEHSSIVNVNGKVNTLPKEWRMICETKEVQSA
ncbi:glycoside hydrolase family 3 N-terminal domain-containing protein [Vibrio breoganii]|uniref:glycoside hydrolase family 3 N-terminal domain-containing protein n=1 Tax=Vibrio breoganii TaxID=553239 RepID=UPI0021C47F20|nr:glycoside hydrolase family 3 N-terminal domain-containing protein [Vibrio breoganii]MDN3716616.1 glycoside hydrolase family 3 N-terminal domain-containing protein [Vibrio breoganii]